MSTRADLIKRIREHMVAAENLTRELSYTGDWPTDLSCAFWRLCGNDTEGHVFVVEGCDGLNAIHDVELFLCHSCHDALHRAALGAQYTPITPTGEERAA